MVNFDFVSKLNELVNPEIDNIVNKSVSGLMERFFLNMKDKYQQVDISELRQMLLESQGYSHEKAEEMKDTQLAEPLEITTKNTKVTKTTKTNKKKEKVPCQHVMGPRSKNPGSVCGKNVTDASEGFTHCKTHRNTDPLVQSGKAPGKPKKSTSKDSKTKKKLNPALSVQKEVIDDEEVITETLEVKIDYNKFGYYEDPMTKFLFNNDGEVFGKQCHDTGNVLELDDADMKVANINEWEYFPNRKPEPFVEGQTGEVC